MRIKNCTYNDLVLALQKVNEKFDDNIFFIEETPERYKNKDKDWRVRLGVRDCHEAGALLHAHYVDPSGAGKQKLRRSNYACWHAHGEFFDALPEGTKVQAGRITYTCPIGRDNWQDYNVHNQFTPVYASESCLCTGEVSLEWAKSKYEKSKAI